MTILPPHSLDSDWTCSYRNDPADSNPVPSLAAWSFDANHGENRIAWLRRSFSLEPTVDCVNYVLHIDSAPADTRIYVNDEHVGDYDSPAPENQPFELDVTYYVALGENTLALGVSGNAAGRFEGVRLQPVSCE